MSHLSLAINDARRSMAETQTAFAARASLHPTQISKASKGKRVGAAVIHSITRALPAEHRGAVAAAWLKDQLKPDVLATVEVFSASRPAAEPPNYQLPPDLDSDTRDLILWLAQQATRHSAVRDALYSLRRAAEVTGLPPALKNNQNNVLTFNRTALDSTRQSKSCDPTGAEPGTRKKLEYK